MDRSTADRPSPPSRPARRGRARSKHRAHWPSARKPPDVAADLTLDEGLDRTLKPERRRRGASRARRRPTACLICACRPCRRAPDERAVNRRRPPQPSPAPARPRSRFYEPKMKTSTIVLSQLARLRRARRLERRRRPGEVGEAGAVTVREHDDPRHVVSPARVAVTSTRSRQATPRGRSALPLNAARSPRSSGASKLLLGRGARRLVRASRADYPFRVRRGHPQRPVRAQACNFTERPVGVDDVGRRRVAAPGSSRSARARAGDEQRDQRRQGEQCSTREHAATASKVRA